MIATTAMAVEVPISRSKSLASLRLRPSQASVRSTIQPRLRPHFRRNRGRLAPAGPRRQMEPLGVARAPADLKPQPLARGAGGGFASGVDPVRIADRWRAGAFEGESGGESVRRPG